MMDGHAFPSKVEDLITKPFPPRHAMRIKRKAQRTLLSPLRHARAVMAPEYNSAKCFPRNFNEISGGISPSLLSSPFKTSLIQARSIAARFPPFVPICRLDSFLRELLNHPCFLSDREDRILARTSSNFTIEKKSDKSEGKGK